MTSTYSDVVLDFDLGFLHENEASLLPTKQEKQKRALLIAKKKTIATDLLIRKYYEKKDLVEQIEKNLYESKEECKQVCLDYRNALQKVAYLEENEHKFQIVNNDINEKYSVSETRCSAIQSHANQLQQLVKEHETKIEALEIENKLERANTKDVEKKVVSLEKDKELMQQHIQILRNIVLGKKKIDRTAKTILDKYKTTNEEESLCDDDSEIEDVVSSSWQDDDDGAECDNQDTMSCNVKELESNEIKVDLINKIEPVSSNLECQVKELILKNDKKNKSTEIIEHGHCSDNDLALSDDTGRGSSLAISDSERCYLENGSPDSIEVNRDKNAHSDISSQKTVDSVEKATSPIVFKVSDYTSQSDQVFTVINENVDSNTNDGFENPLIAINNIDSVKCTVIMDDNISDTVMQDIPVKELTKNNKENLMNVHVVKPNNKMIADDENDNMDCEVSSILSTMKLRYDLITPLPASPNPSSQSAPVDNTSIHNCLEAAQVREENKILQASLQSLAKQVMEIRSMLKLQSTTEKDSRLLEQRQDTGKVVEKEIEKERHNSVSLEEDDPITLIPQFDNSSHIIETNHQIVEKNNTMSEQDTYESEIEPDLIVIPVTESQLEKCDEHSISNKTENKNTIKKKAKLSKLQKIKNKLQPKRKIKLVELPPSKRQQSKQVPKPNLNVNKIHNEESCATLNDKTIYAKALKVVSEMRAKEQIKCEVKSVKKRTSEINCVHDNVPVKEQSQHVSEAIIEKGEGHTDNHSEHLHKENTIKDKPLKNKMIPPLSPKVPRTTRSRKKYENANNTPIEDNACKSNVKDDPTAVDNNNEINHNDLSNIKTRSKISTLKRPASEVIESSQNKRILRSTSFTSDPPGDFILNKSNSNLKDSKEAVTNNANISDVRKKCVDYSDLMECTPSNENIECTTSSSSQKEQNPLQYHPKQSVLCKMIQKYGVECNRIKHKTISGPDTDTVCKNIEDSLERIVKLQGDAVKKSMVEMVQEMKLFSHKQFLSGLLKYLKNAERKIELLAKTCTPPAPPMTKQEQILLYVITELKPHYPSVDIVDEVLKNIEYSLFRLNQTPEFDVVESLSHFYAVLCRFTKAKNRLRMFILDAMYCIAYKAIPLIRQCIDVWTHVIPLSHMDTAQSPLVKCLIYLLHFYKCDDKFNRVKEMRFLLNKRYSFDMSVWSEKTILETLRSSIMDTSDSPLERRMLKLALLIVAKRHGPQWSQKHLVQRLLLPLVRGEGVRGEGEGGTTAARRLALGLLGPLMKPYSNDMKVHCEIVINTMFDMLHQPNSDEDVEAIMSTLIFMNKHNSSRVINALLSWNPKGPISAEMERLLSDYVKEKPIKVWTHVLSNYANVNQM